MLVMMNHKKQDRRREMLRIMLIIILILFCWMLLSIGMGWWIGAVKKIRRRDD